MKSNPERDRDEALRGVLREWRVDPPLPPRFQEQVWQRIRRAENEAGSVPWTGLSRFLERAWLRPRIAFACLSVFLALGMAAGALAAQAKTSRLNAELGSRYVQSVDPYRSGAALP